MNESIETSERDAFEPRMLRLPVREMSAEPAPPPVAAGYEAHPVGTGERLRRLDRVNAELVEALQWVRGHISRYDPPGLPNHVTQRIDAALTSATKETT